MPNMRDVIQMLDDSGSQKLYASNGHVKYRLPNGNLFVTAGTPSDHRSFSNAMARLRRELKVTHPEIADRHRTSTLPKNKRYATNTLGDFIKQPISGFSAIPGATPVEAEFQIIEREKPPEENPPIRQHHYPIRKHRRELSPPPSPPKTLSPEQLIEANRILHSKGNAAMNCYINQCRSGLVSVTRQLLAERSPEPIVAPQNRVLPKSHHTEEDEMSNVLERARAELQSTNSRIETYEAQLADINAKKDSDGLRKMQLEEYITKHEALVNEATALLTEILPPEPPPPVLASPAKKVSPRGKYGPRLDFGMREIEKHIFPALRARSNQFTLEEFVEAIYAHGFDGPKGNRNQLANWLYPYLKTPDCQIVKSGHAVFSFKQPDLRHISQETSQMEAVN